ncbi:MAG: GTPase ObgE [Gemmatimonadales bacterium]
MAFIDRAKIRVTAGMGGSGCSSFRREKFRPMGGPDGGNGGRGGSVYVRADPQLSTLLDYSYRRVFRATRGQHGRGSDKAGKSGEDVYLPVPPGTEIRDAESGEMLTELLVAGEEFCVAKGGRGGRGNAAFATPTNRAPRKWEPGEEGEDRHIELVLKLIADVGLLGEPNAGKSTLLSALSAARPKIADYPFTTLEPNLGVVGLPESRSFVLADIPGIIEGAHTGKGLGDQFLQHVERTRVLAYIIPLDVDDPQLAYEMLRDEARQYDAALAERPHVVVFTKRDLLGPDEDVPPLVAPDAARVLTVSAVARRGLGELKEQLWELLGTVASAREESV